MMILNKHIDHFAADPAAKLSNYVEKYYSISIRNDAMLSILEYSVAPRAKPVLVVKRNRSQEDFQVLLAGPHLKNHKVLIRKSEQWFIAVLNPGSCFSLFGILASAIKENAVNLREVNIELWDRIRSTFQQEFSPKSMDEILLSLNLDFNLPPMVLEAIQRLSSAQNYRVSLVAEELGINIRQLQREFGRWVGVSPKQFQRITRLRKILDHAHKNGSQTWTQIAAKSGYFDQSHLNKEISDVFEVKPTEIKKLK